MTSLKVRLAALSALVLAVGFVALSSGADRAAAPPAPSFTDIGATLEGVVYGDVDWGDYDSDGDLDLALTGLTSGAAASKIYRNDSGVFTDSGAVLIGLFGSSVEWGDYDSDGDLDLLLTGIGGAASSVSALYRNDGAAGFVSVPAGLPGVEFGSAAWGDYDSDGDLDIALTGMGNTGTPIGKIYRNDGGGTFTDIGAALTGVGDSSVAWGDYDSDGKLDLALCGFNGTVRASKIYRNNGGGSFTDIGAPLAAVSMGSAAWGDYDSDGDLDIALTGYDIASTPISKIYRNDGDGAFTAIGADLPGVFNKGTGAWGDYDSDGDLDVLLVGGGLVDPPVAWVYRNDGAGTFVDIDTGLLGVRNGNSATWGDYDADGKLDIALVGTDGTSHIAKIYRNTTATANTAPKAPSALLAKRDSAGRVFLSWKAASDSTTAEAALGYNLKLNKGSTQVFTSMAATNGYRRVARMGNLGQTRTITLSDLTNGTYEWSVQAIDTSFAGSAFAGMKTFKLPGSFVSIKLSPSKIRSCRKPTSATYKGEIVPAPKPAVKVTLQKRQGKRWKKVKVVKTNSSGAFRFKNVGKKYKKSVRFRVVSELPGGAKITSGSKKLRVKLC